jgi:SRSO17 transposase
MMFPEHFSGDPMMNADQIRSLRPALGALLDTFRSCFPTINSFRHLTNYVSGVMTDMTRKSIEPVALACHTSVRTLQEFLSHLPWDDFRANTVLQHYVADHHASDKAIGVIDNSAHRKQGDMTPGVQRQWCGEMGKVEKCVIRQHLLYTDNGSGAAGDESHGHQQRNGHGFGVNWARS